LDKFIALLVCDIVDHSHLKVSDEADMTVSRRTFLPEVTGREHIAHIAFGGDLPFVLKESDHQSIRGDNVLWVAGIHRCIDIDIPIEDLGFKEEGDARRTADRI
jgi:hypothetical protein